MAGDGGDGQAVEESDGRAFALARTIALVNDKGGVGKTSIAANLAGQFAAAGYRCLLVDLNRQANLADDLGFRGDEVDDQGAGLLMALMAGTPVAPARDVRPGLDVVPGGARLADLTPVMVGRVQDRGREAFRALGDVLAPVAGDYDLVLVDCPPESTVLTDLALTAARWVLMPTRSDAGGLVGMGLVAERFALARELNPDLGLLGAVLFATGSRSRQVHAEVRAAVERAFGGHSPLFTTAIRHAERTAQDARRLGRLAHELEREVEQQPAWWEALRAASSGQVPAPRVAPSAAGVAADYRELGIEVLSLLRAAEEAAEDGRAESGRSPDEQAASGHDAADRDAIGQDGAGPVGADQDANGQDANGQDANGQDANGHDANGHAGTAQGGADEPRRDATGRARRARRPGRAPDRPATDRSRPSRGASGAAR